MSCMWCGGNHTPDKQLGCPNMPEGAVFYTPDDSHKEEENDNVQERKAEVPLQALPGVGGLFSPIALA